MSLLQRLRDAGAGILVDGLDGSSAGVSQVSYLPGFHLVQPGLEAFADSSTSFLRSRARRSPASGPQRSREGVVAVGQLQTQVANDVASANELKPAQAGALTTPPPPESCRAARSVRVALRALWSVVSLAESAAFVAYEASSVVSVGLGPLERRDASRQASCAVTKVFGGETQQGICYLGV